MTLKAFVLGGKFVLCGGAQGFQGAMGVADMRHVIIGGIG